MASALLFLVPGLVCLGVASSHMGKHAFPAILSLPGLLVKRWQDVCSSFTLWVGTWYSVSAYSNDMVGTLYTQISCCLASGLIQWVALEDGNSPRISRRQPSQCRVRI